MNNLNLKYGARRGRRARNRAIQVRVFIKFKSLKFSESQGFRVELLKHRAVTSHGPPSPAARASVTRTSRSSSSPLTTGPSFNLPVKFNCDLTTPGRGCHCQCILLRVSGTRTPGPRAGDGSRAPPRRPGRDAPNHDGRAGPEIGNVRVRGRSMIMIINHPRRVNMRRPGPGRRAPPAARRAAQCIPA